jgi:hypothetical protein
VSCTNHEALSYRPAADSDYLVSCAVENYRGAR